MPPKKSRTTRKTVKRPSATAPQETEPTKNMCIVVIRLRGAAGLDTATIKTLHNMRLLNKYNAAIIPDNDSTRGMLQKVKDYVTWGEPTVETVSALLTERADVFGASSLTPELLKNRLQLSTIPQLAHGIRSGEVTSKTLEHAGVSLRFRLRPPRKGFKYTIKRPYMDRGELGYRGEDINSLIRRMI